MIIVWVVTRLVVSIAYIATQYFIYRKILDFIALFPNLRESAKLRTGLRYFFILVNCPLIFVIAPFRSLPFAALFLYPSSIWVAGSLSSFAILSIIQVLLLLGNFLRNRYSARAHRSLRMQETVSRRRFLQVTSSFVATAPVAAFAYGAANATDKGITVEESQIPVQNLPSGLTGLSICQLSDIHFESFVDPAELERVVERTNRLNPDLIFLTGDFISYNSSSVEPFMEIFSRLQARHGIFGCLGNHEVYTDTQEAFKQEFKKHGMDLLRNEVRDLHINNESLRLLGVKYVRDFVRPSVVNFLRESTSKNPMILLSHHPNVFPTAADCGIDLTFSGHTHGGQITLKLGDVKLAPSQIVSPYVAGRYTIGNSSLYVNRGLGTVGPPLRLNSAPEISFVKLIPGPERHAEGARGEASERPPDR